MNQNSLISCYLFSKKYKTNELPWDEKIGFDHPSVEGVVVVATGDMGHSLKKMRNALETSGKERHSRELLLNGLPLSLQMLYDVWKLSPDAKNEHGVMIYL